MTAATTSRLARSERGQAYVEFALILPILLLIVMGIIQFGTVFRTYITLTDATRVGGRQAAVSRSILPASNRIPLIEQKMHLAAAGLDASKMVITVDAKDVDGKPGWGGAGEVTVRASYPFQVNLFGLVIFDSTINSRTTERIE